MPLHALGAQVLGQVNLLAKIAEDAIATGVCSVKAVVTSVPPAAPLRSTTGASFTAEIVMVAVREMLLFFADLYGVPPEKAEGELQEYHGRHEHERHPRGVAELRV